MKLRRPQSLNGLILVGFGFVALPLLLAVIWALVNLDRVAAQSERLVITGVSAAENNRRLEEQLNTLERVALQYQVLRNPDSLQVSATAAFFEALREAYPCAPAPAAPPPTPEGAEDGAPESSAEDADDIPSE